MLKIKGHSSMVACPCSQNLYACIFSRGVNFLEWCTLTLAEIFPIYKFTIPTTEVRISCDQ